MVGVNVRGGAYVSDTCVRSSVSQKFRQAINGRTHTSIVPTATVSRLWTAVN